MSETESSKVSSESSRLRRRHPATATNHNDSSFDLWIMDDEFLLESAGSTAPLDAKIADLAEGFFEEGDEWE